MASESPAPERPASERPASELKGAQTLKEGLGPGKCCWTLMGIKALFGVEALFLPRTGSLLQLTVSIPEKIPRVLL